MNVTSNFARHRGTTSHLSLDDDIILNTLKSFRKEREREREKKKRGGTKLKTICREGRSAEYLGYIKMMRNGESGRGEGRGREGGIFLSVWMVVSIVYT